MEMDKGKNTTFIVLIASLAMVTDNILQTAILPILPEYFYEETKNHVDVGIPVGNLNSSHNTQVFGNSNCTSDSFLLSENIYIGLLVAAKPFVQFIVATLIGPFVDRCGYDVPMFLGFGIIIASSLVFGYGITYAVLFVARSFQGIGSACIDVASLAMVADMFDDIDQRGKMLGFILSGYAFGELIGPTFGSVTYTTAGKTAPFIIIACFTAFLAVAYFFSHKLSTKPLCKENEKTNLVQLLKDPYVMVCALTVGISALPIGVQESGQPLWMMQTMCPKKWMLGVAFLPHTVSFILTLLILPYIFSNSNRWLALTIGLAVIGIATILLPLSTSVWMLFGPGSFLGAGFAAVEYSVYPILSQLVDQRHLPGMYARAYSILELTFCLSNALGPFLCAAFVIVIGYKGLMVCVGVVTFICFPIGIYLRDPPSRYQTEKLLGNDCQALLTSATL